MVGSAPLAWLLTSLFVVTAGYGLRRVARTYAAPLAHTAAGGTAPSSGARASTAGVVTAVEHRPGELCHLLMSIAMVAMVWMWGGPGGEVLQLVVFGLFTALFAVRALSARSYSGGHDSVEYAAHAWLSGSMVWMVAAMPIMTGHDWTSGPGGHHHDASAPGIAGPTPALATVAPAWTVVVTLVLVAGLLAAVVRAGGAARDGSSDRAGAAAHALMGLGMAVMLLVMI